jgi:hypothetical protein
LDAATKLFGSEPGSRGELPVSGAVKILLGDDLRAVWSEAT